jgi:predicted dehydrogenase
MVSQNRRYLPGLIAFRDTVAHLGRLSDLTCQFFIAHRDDAAEFLFAFRDPLLLDMAIHLFDGARAITGADPLTVYCEASNPPWSWYEGDAAADAVFAMSGGLRFAFTGNWAREGFATSWTGSWRATGERGSAIWEDEGAPVVSPARGHRIEAVAPEPLVRSPHRFPGLEFSLAEFVDALRTGRVPAGECHDNVRSLAMCHAAVESARTGHRVAVDGLVA